jgi:hypothetical protein
MKRLLLSLLTTAFALLIVVPAAAPAGGVENFGLSCNDGTNLAVALDPAGLTNLSSAVSAINLNPTGDPALVCSLNQPGTTSSSSNNGSAHDFAVGGGQLFFPPPFTTCAHESFAFSAHVPTGSAAAPPQPGVGGTYNESLSGPPGCGDHGQLVAKVDCLQVTANPSGGGTAILTAEITRSTFAGIDVGDEISSTLTDSGTNVGDTLGDILTNGPCQFKAPTTTLPVAQGNINIKSGA